MPDEMAPAAPAAPAGPMPGAPPNAMQPPGPTGPATMAPNRQGQRLQGMIAANIGLVMLDKALGMVGSTSDEGQALLKAIQALSKIFSAPRSHDLSNAEMKLMGAKQGPMAPPAQGGMAPGMAARDRLAALGMGGGGPQGA